MMLARLEPKLNEKILTAQIKSISRHGVNSNIDLNYIENNIALLLQQQLMQ